MSFKEILLACFIGSAAGMFISGIPLMDTLIAYPIAVTISWFAFGKRSHG